MASTTEQCRAWRVYRIQTAQGREITFFPFHQKEWETVVGSGIGKLERGGKKNPAADSSEQSCLQHKSTQGLPPLHPNPPLLLIPNHFHQSFQSAAESGGGREIHPTLKSDKICQLGRGAPSLNQRGKLFVEILVTVGEFRLFPRRRRRRSGKKKKKTPLARAADPESWWWEEEKIWRRGRKKEEGVWMFGGGGRRLRSFESGRRRRRRSSQASQPSPSRGFHPSFSKGFFSLPFLSSRRVSRGMSRGNARFDNLKHFFNEACFPKVRSI